MCFLCDAFIFIVNRNLVVVWKLTSLASTQMFFWLIMQSFTTLVEKEQVMKP